MVGPRNKILSSLQPWCIQPYFKKLISLAAPEQKRCPGEKVFGLGKSTFSLLSYPFDFLYLCGSHTKQSQVGGPMRQTTVVVPVQRRWPGPGAQAVVSLFGESGWGCSCWPASSQPFDLSPLGTLRGVGRSSIPRAVLGIWGPVQRRFNSSGSDLISPSFFFYFFFPFSLRRAVSSLLQLCFQRIAKHLPRVKGSHRDWQLSTPAACPS